MRTWTITDAQDRFTDILRASSQEPQFVYDQNNPVGVVLDFSFYTRLMNRRVHQPRPTIAELLDELSEIQKSEAVELEVPTRQDRPNVMVS